MNRRPIYAAARRLIVHGLGVLNTVGPALLGLRGSTRAVPAVAAGVQGTLNALTSQPFVIQRAIPFRPHGCPNRRASRPSSSRWS